MNRVKIVATIGPATNNAVALGALVDAGMSIARLNGSHADLEWHAETIKLIKKEFPEMPILLDIPGRKIRTTLLSHEPSFDKNDIIILTVDTSHDGTEKIPVNYARLHKNLEPGAIILADDGTLRFTVTKIDGDDIYCRAETPGTLKSRKGINVPHVNLGMDLITERDRSMMKFARENEVDYVGISFVESAAHVEAIRELAGESWPRIVAKVENQGGIDNLQEIIGATDVVMIDRGDLSVETQLETLSVVQKEILIAASKIGKPVIVATELLHTMIENSFPTKAEVSDITNAVLDGCAATMLSGETAIGKHPTESVALMKSVIEATETHYQNSIDNTNLRNKPSAQEYGDVPEVMADAIAMISRALPITKIITFTKTGYAARKIAALSPRQPIIAVSDDLMAAKSFNLFPGTNGVFVDVPFLKTNTEYIPLGLKDLWERGLIAEDDLIIITAVTYPQSGNRMNLIETHNVSDLKKTFSWK